MERDDGEGWWRGMTNLLSIKLLLDSATVVESSRSRSLVRWLEGEVEVQEMEKSR